MADWGTRTGTVRDPTTEPGRVQSDLPLTFTHNPDATFNYGAIAGLVRDPTGTAGIVEVIVYQNAPPTQDDPGDHLTQLYFTDSLPTDLTTLYVVATGEILAVKEIWLINNSGASRTVDIVFQDSQAGVVTRTYALDASGDGAERKVEMWRILYPSQLVRAEASGQDVGCIISVVKNVAAA